MASPVSHPDPASVVFGESDFGERQVFTPEQWPYFDGMGWHRVGPPVLPPTTYAPNLRPEKPFAVHYRTLTGERVREFASAEERGMWLMLEEPRGTAILAVINRVDPAAIPLRWRRSQQPQDFRADVLAARVDPDAFPRWRSMHLASYARSGDLTHLADAAYCGAVMDAASRTEG